MSQAPSTAPANWAADWVKDNLTTIYTSTTQPDFDSVFTNFPTEDAVIIVNGAKFSREEYKEYLEKERTLANVGVVKFLNAVEVPTGEEKTKNGTITRASVGVFYEVIVYKPLGTGSIRSIVTSSLNVNVKREFGTFPPPAIGSFLVTTATSLNQVIIERVALLKGE